MKKSGSSRTSDRIDLLPEKKRYEPGETAGCRCACPSARPPRWSQSSAKASSTASSCRSSGRDPTVEFRSRPHYAPNVYISVFVVRGRVGDVQPTALVDLGKPALQAGHRRIAVGQKGTNWPSSPIPTSPSTRSATKRWRGCASPAPGGTPAKGGEFALAAVDEGLLELAPNDSWQLLTRMMGRRGLGVETATAQAQVIGKRHFGLKALPAGGGGGRQPTRELFDTLIKWEARVVLDDNGEAR